MNDSVFTILICGAGQLGSRYLQGLAKCRLPLRVYVQDSYEGSLVRARQRWNEVLSPEVTHDVSFHSSFELLPRQVDIAIVATTADVRPQVVGEIANHSAVRFWVLEKVLAQREAGLDELMAHVRDGSRAWVNTIRRMVPWHQQIRSQLGLDYPLTLEVEGGLWGIACNAVHLLDLLAWWTGETLQNVCTDRLNPNWFESNRQGYWEVLGTLEAQFSGGSHARLSTGKDGVSISMAVSDRHQLWLIKESEGLARRSDGIEILGRMPQQSEMSATLVESILEGGCCALPTLEESVAMHRVFIRSMQEHWNHAGNPTATFVPIT